MPGGNIPETHARGFTLVELMVVMAILGLLLVLTIPGMRSALERSRSAACINNLRTLGQATALYAADEKGFIPFQFNEGGQGQGYADPPWFNLLAPYVSAVIQTEISLLSGTDQAFRCPSQRGDFAVSYGPSSGHLLDGPRLSMTRIAAPGEKIWLIDVPIGNVYFFNPALPSEHWLAPRHGDGVHALFFDGRVEWLSAEEVEANRPIMFQATRN